MSIKYLNLVLTSCLSIHRLIVHRSAEVLDWECRRVVRARLVCLPIEPYQYLLQTPIITYHWGEGEVRRNMKLELLMWPVPICIHEAIVKSNQRNMLIGSFHTTPHPPFHAFQPTNNLNQNHIEHFCQLFREIRA